MGHAGYWASFPALLLDHAWCPLATQKPLMFPAAGTGTFPGPDTALSQGFMLLCLVRQF